METLPDNLLSLLCHSDIANIFLGLELLNSQKSEQEVGLIGGAIYLTASHSLRTELSKQSILQNSKFVKYLSSKIYCSRLFHSKRFFSKCFITYPQINASQFVLYSNFFNQHKNYSKILYLYHFEDYSLEFDWKALKSSTQIIHLGVLPASLSSETKLTQLTQKLLELPGLKKIVFQVQHDTQLFETFLETFHDKIDWDAISQQPYLPKNFIRKYEHKLNWESIGKHQKIGKSFLKEFLHKFDKKILLRYQRFTEDLILEIIDDSFDLEQSSKNFWGIISKHQRLSENFISMYADKLDWFYISCYQKLSSGFISEFFSQLSLGSLIIYQTLTDAQIRHLVETCTSKNKYIPWHKLIKYQKLTEQFMEDYASKLSWWHISYHQKLSESFII